MPAGGMGGCASPPCRGVQGGRPPQAIGRGKAMPERADEARETSDDTREALLAEAAALWAAQDSEVGPPGDPGRAIGDLPGFLSAYYRLGATDDLVTAGPRRVAAVAARNAALVESRPQGR